MIPSLACGYLGVGFAIHMGTTGPSLGANTTSGPNICASNYCLAMSFHGTGSSTLFSPRNSVGS